MQMRLYKQFYMIFVLLRACLWNVSISFAGNVEEKLSVDGFDDKRHVNKNIIKVSANEALYLTADYEEAEQTDLVNTQVIRFTALQECYRGKVYNRKNLNGERARYLRLLLFPDHSFG